jgi:hypothetical protein
VGPPHQRGVLYEDLDCLAGRNGSAKSSIGGWLEADPAWWRVGERLLLRGEWGSTSTTSCGASWHWETAAHTREQDTHPAFIESHRSPTPKREWSGSRPPMRPAGAG